MTTTLYSIGVPWDDIDNGKYEPAAATITYTPVVSPDLSELMEVIDQCKDLAMRLGDAGKVRKLKKRVRKLEKRVRKLEAKK